MKTDGTRARLRLAAVAATVAAAAAVGSAPAFADTLSANCNTACDLYAKPSTMNVPGVGSVNTWVFTMDDTAAAPPIAGATVVANDNTAVSITVHNETTEPLRFSVPQQVGFNGAAVTIAPAGVHTYTFTTHAGTSLYEAGPGAPAARRQIAMGLYGAMVVLSGTAGQAYNDSTTAYNDEKVLVLSDLDPALNNSADPAAADIHASVDRPHYWLVNGSVATPDLTVDPTNLGGAKVLLRYLNAGLDEHDMGVLGLPQTHIAQDGIRRTAGLIAAPQDAVVEILPSGATADDIVDVSTMAANERIPVYDTGKANDPAGDGLAVMLHAGLTDAANCTTPSVNPTSVSGSPSNGGPIPVTVNFEVNGCGAASTSPVEWWLDSPTPPAVTDTVTTSPITVTPAPSLASGVHHVYMRANDGTTIGDISSAAFVYDVDGPATGHLSITPTNSNGTRDVVIIGTANDNGHGGSDVTAASYRIDGGSAVPMDMPTALTPDVTGPVQPLRGVIPAAAVALLSEGIHTVSVVGTDAFGNTTTNAAAGTIDFVVDKTGPAAVGAPSTLIDDSQNWAPNSLVGLTVTITEASATAAGLTGESATITANTDTTLTVNAAWGVVTNRGVSYVINTAGTVTSASTNVLNFTAGSPAIGNNALVGAVVQADGQRRTITANTSSQLTVDSNWAAGLSAGTPFTVILPNGKVTSATGSTLVASNATLLTTGTLAGSLVALTSGTAGSTVAGQISTIVSNTGQTMTVDPGWANTPGTGTGFIIIRAGSTVVAQGTRTNGTTTTQFNDSAAHFSTTGSGLAGAGDALVILSGTQAGQVRRITANTATSLTVSPAFGAAPGPGSKYMVVTPATAGATAGTNSAGISDTAGTFAGASGSSVRLTDTSNIGNVTANETARTVAASSTATRLNVTSAFDTTSPPTAGVRYVVYRTGTTAAGSVSPSITDAAGHYATNSLVGLRLRADGQENTVISNTATLIRLRNNWAPPVANTPYSLFGTGTANATGTTLTDGTGLVAATVTNGIAKLMTNGQARSTIGYNPGSGVFTVRPAWTGGPFNGVTYVLTLRTGIGTIATHDPVSILPNPNNGTLSFDEELFALKAEANFHDSLSNVTYVAGNFVNDTTTPTTCPPILKSGPVDPNTGPQIDPHSALGRMDPVGAGFTQDADAYSEPPLSVMNPWIPPTSPIGVSTHYFAVRAVDAAGNEGPCSYAALVIDTQNPIPPAARIALLRAGANLRAHSAKRFKLTVSGADNLAVAGGEWFVGHDKGKGKGHKLAATDGHFGSLREQMSAVISTRGWKHGKYAISVRVRDRAGNWSKVVKLKIRV